uniref:Expressed protein n=1 Tax=Oryza sativa subsp. japonica TaxID=39947 RepID=Q7XEP4_ORYSJ|nr:expressed protein [Oryza sativa Japonica Group]
MTFFFLLALEVKALSICNVLELKDAPSVVAGVKKCWNVCCDDPRVQGWMLHIIKELSMLQFISVRYNVSALRIKPFFQCKEEKGKFSQCAVYILQVISKDFDAPYFFPENFKKMLDANVFSSFQILHKKKSVAVDSRITLNLEKTT